MGHGDWLEVIADPVRLQILRCLCEVTEATAPELAGSSQTSYQTLRRHLDALETSGVVRARPGTSDGANTGRPAMLFSLSPSVRESARAILQTS